MVWYKKNLNVNFYQGQVNTVNILSICSLVLFFKGLETGKFNEGSPKLPYCVRYIALHPRLEKWAPLFCFLRPLSQEEEQRKKIEVIERATG